MCFPFLYLCYPLQAPPYHSFYLTARWLHQCIYGRLCIVTLHCLPLCHLSAISKINYPSNKTINSKSGSVLLFVSNCAKLFKITLMGNKNTGGIKKKLGGWCCFCGSNYLTPLRQDNQTLVCICHEDPSTDRLRADLSLDCSNQGNQMWRHWGKQLWERRKRSWTEEEVQGRKWGRRCCAQVA